MRRSEIESLGNDRTDVRGLSSNGQEVGGVNGNVPAVFLEPDRQLGTQIENRSKVIATERFKIGHGSDQAHLSLHPYMSSKFKPLLDQLSEAANVQIENRSGSDCPASTISSP